MKRTGWIMILLGLAAFVVPAQEKQGPSDRGETTLSIGGGKVTVEYGRPPLNGRDLNKMLEPGMEWRMGSNTPTTLSTDIDLKFGDKVVSKGKYVLKAKLIEAGKWNLMIYTEKTAVAEVPLTTGRNASSVELVTVKLEKQGSGGKFTLEWGGMSISTVFQKA
jgi:hypothetical protein